MFTRNWLRCYRYPRVSAAPVYKTHFTQYENFGEKENTKNRPNLVQAKCLYSNIRRIGKVCLSIFWFKKSVANISVFKLTFTVIYRLLSR